MAAAAARASLPLAFEALPPIEARARAIVAPAVPAAPAFAPSRLALCARKPGRTDAHAVRAVTVETAPARTSDRQLARVARVAGEARTRAGAKVRPPPARALAGALDKRLVRTGQRRGGRSNGDASRTRRSGTVGTGPSPAAQAFTALCASAVPIAVRGARLLRAVVAPPTRQALTLAPSLGKDAVRPTVATAARPAAFGIDALRRLRHVARVAAPTRRADAPPARARAVRAAIEFAAELLARRSAPASPAAACAVGRAVAMGGAVVGAGAHGAV